MRRNAFEQHAGSNPFNPACRVEPGVRREPGTEPQQRFIDQVHHVEHSATAQPVVLRHHGDHEHWVEQPAEKTIVTVRQDGNVHVSGFQARRQATALVFNKLNLDARMTLAVALQKVREQIFHDLGSGPNTQYAGLTGLECTCPLAERFRFRQQTTAAHKKVLAFRGELDATPDPIEQTDAQLALERMNLPRRCRLRQVQSDRGACKTAVVSDRNEGAQKSQIHWDAFQILIDKWTINELDTSIAPWLAFHKSTGVTGQRFRGRERKHDETSPPSISKSRSGRRHAARHRAISLGRRAIRSGPSDGSSDFHPAARPTSWPGSSHRGCRSDLVSKSSLRTSRGRHELGRAVGHQCSARWTHVAVRDARSTRSTRRCMVGLPLTSSVTLPRSPGS